MTFNPNIPQGNQTIASTTNGIQTNFSQTNTAFGVDHVALTVLTNQGMHNKVSLIQQASDPTVGAVIPVLYCKSTTSNTVNNDLYFRRASNDASTVVQLTTTKVNPTASTNGYTFLPGGIIVQWGFQATPTDNVQVNFPITFPNAAFTCVISPVKNGSVSSLSGPTLKQAPSTTGFIPRFSGTTLDAISFYAIGN